MILGINCTPAFCAAKSAESSTPEQLIRNALESML